MRLTCAAALLMAILTSGCQSTAENVWAERPGPKVLTSFAPIQCFAMNVAGDDAQVLPVMTDQGPHHYDGNIRDARKLNKADLFLINGLVLDDSIANRLKRGSSNSTLKIVSLGEAIPVDRLKKGFTCTHDHSAGHEHEHGDYDPHVWLGIPEAILMVGRIRDTLKTADPAHASGYDQRANAFVERLQKLQEEGKELLKGKTERRLVTFHDSLFYFGRSFGIEIADVIETTPGKEPSPKELSSIVKLCQEKGTRVIAVEPQYPKNTSAKTILTELRGKKIDAAFVEIDPMETARAGEITLEYFERKTRENLKNLADVLR
jgi:ABC-type Zn uptake system ZnuABC Zn-binding protein ZnuA